MLHILGMIGKGIRIALLCILILVAALLLAILFVPIRYRVAGKLEEGKADGKAKVHWLFHIVTAFASWEGKLRYGIRIFGIPVYDNLRREQKQKKKQERERKQAKQRAEKNRQKPLQKPQPKRQPEPEQPRLVSKPASQPAPETRPEQPRLVSKEAPPRAESVQPESKPEQPRLVSKETPPEEQRPGRLKRLAEKIKAFFRMLAGLGKKIWNIPHKIQEKLQNLKEKVDGIRETIEAYRTFLEREDFKRAFALCKKQLLRVWKNIRPSKVKADIHFGFDDPSVTGQILAYLGMFYPILGKDIRIRPDFENTVYEGKVLIKGRVTIFILLRVLWILYFDKDIKRLIRVWKKEETLHGRK